MFCQPSHGAPFTNNLYDADMSEAHCTPFDYFVPNAPEQTADIAHLGALDALGNAMVAQIASPNDNSAMPPILTYLGQFIDHDITAGTDRDQNEGKIDSDTLAPRPRDKVRKERLNFRTGRLDLDSLYGGCMDGVTPNAADVDFQRKLRQQMRWPSDPAKMRIAFYQSKTSSGDDIPSVDLPRDRAGDILRLGRLLATGAVKQSELNNLSTDLRSMYLNDDGSPNVQRGIIGDSRNDENLIVAQVHLAFLRMHNVLVDQCDDPAVQAEGREAVFSWAQQRLRWLHQWLTVNYYLSALCQPHTLSQVIGEGGQFYLDWRAKIGCESGHLPLPLEFSVAGFRFGHSMVRPEYDWNKFFGRGSGPANQLDRAPFNLMFAFTGGGNLAGSGRRLPANWGADWPRLVNPPSEPDRGARKIDTRLALPLSELPDGPPSSILAHLARRNLRRAYALNLPSGQACLKMFAPGETPLCGDELGTDEIGEILDQSTLRDETPLWYYILREAEVQENGECLGTLGTHIVAQTLLGLVVADDASYWHQPGSDQGRWHPQDLSHGNHEPITSMAALLSAAGLF